MKQELLNSERLLKNKPSEVYGEEEIGRWELRFSFFFFLF